MGQIFDLKQDDLEAFKEIVDLIKTKKGHCSAFEQSLLVDYSKKFGLPILRSAIFQCMSCDWLIVGMYFRQCDLVKKYGVEKVEWGIDRLAGRKNYSQDVLEGIVKGDIPAYRKQSEPAAKPKASKYPTSDGLHTQGTAIEWLIQKGHDTDQLTEFFDLAGKDAEHGFSVIKLKPEYR